MRCIVCGGDHQPSAKLCDSDGMDREIARLGPKRWNALTAHVSRTNNKRNRAISIPCKSMVVEAVQAANWESD